VYTYVGNIASIEALQIQQAYIWYVYHASFMPCFHELHTAM